MRRPVILLFLLAGFVLPASASAQPRATGTLRVVVQDPSGAVIPGAAVRLTGTDTANASVLRTDLISDGQGVATARDLIPGHYTIEVSFPGFEARTIRDVRVKSGDNRREVALAIERVNQSVSVGLTT